jgi:hypothetical protein
MSKYNHFKKPSKRNKPKRIDDYPSTLRGPSQNKYGGQKMIRMRGYPGNTYGPASEVRRFTKEQCAEYEIKMREEDRLK